MKKLLLVMMALPMLAVAQQKTKSFRIDGVLKNFPDSAKVAQMFAYYRVNGENKTDSAIVADGKFRFNGQISEPTMVRLRAVIADTNVRTLARQYRNALSIVYVEPGGQKFVATGSFENPVVSSSKSHKEYEKLNAASKPYEPAMDSFYSQYSAARQANDKIAQDKAEASIDSLDGVMKEAVYGKYVEDNPSSPLAIFALGQYAGYSIDANKVQPVFDGLSKKVKESPSGIAFQEKLEIARKTGVGATAMEFTQNDTLDQAVSLSSFRGKYVLVDFWASWCGPCRAENPNLVKAFDKFKGRNFQVLGVSLDRPGQKEKWLKAIHDDQLAWTQVSDLKFWDNEVAKLYGIQAIPQNFLIDPNGKIIGRDLRGEALEKALETAIEGKKAF
ncbi:MAG: AhpC/TSA family protein [Chitinophagaceae bacterium]|nr:MAG: AhpC/TSA family protein [Chitinophagaceae bacterium]